MYVITFWYLWSNKNGNYHLFLRNSLHLLPINTLSLSFFITAVQKQRNHVMRKLLFILKKILCYRLHHIFKPLYHGWKCSIYHLYAASRLLFVGHPDSLDYAAKIKVAFILKLFCNPTNQQQEHGEKVWVSNMHTIVPRGLKFFKKKLDQSVQGPHTISHSLNPTIAKVLGGLLVQTPA